MKKSDILLMAVQNLKNRKSRTKLTVIGVVIGTCAIVIMVSIGVGINNMVTAQYDVSSANKITVSSFMNYSESSTEENKQLPLDNSAVDYIKSIKEVEKVVPVIDVTQYVSVTRGKYTSSGAVVLGIDFDELEKLGFTFSQGQMQDANLKTVAYFGDKVITCFADSQGTSVKYSIDENNNIRDCEINAMQDAFYIGALINDSEAQTSAGANSQKLKVGGVINSDSNSGMLTSNVIFIDIEAAKRLINEYNSLNRTEKVSTDYTEINVFVNGVDNVKAVQEKIYAVGLQCYSDQDSLEYTKKIMMVVQLVLGAIGAVSMFVAAFGISNTMVMAVYERTKEIGVMKVLGCSISDIKALFIYEAGIIGVMGGAIGVAISWLVSVIANLIAGAVVSSMGSSGGFSVTVSSVPPWLALLGVAFAALVGIISGASPANRAVKVSALKAIHNE